MNTRLSSPFILPFIILLILISYGSLQYLSAGHTLVLDGYAHTAQVQMVSEVLKKGQWPLWSNDWYCGYPLMQFYSPLFFLIVGATELITHDTELAVKIILFAVNILSGVTIFFLAATITRNYWASIFAGMIYVMAPWHLFQMIDYGRFPVSLIYAFLPLPILFYELYRRRSLSFKKASILSGTSISLLILSHYGYALICVYIFTVYILADFVLGNSSPLTLSIKERLLYVILSGVISFLLSSFFILPIFFESFLVSSAGISVLSSSKGFGLEAATLKMLLTRSSETDLHNGYIGLIGFIAGLLGIIPLFAHRRIGPIIVLCFSLFLLLGYNFQFYQYIPFVYSQGNTGRLIIYLIFTMSITAAYAVTWLNEIRQPWRWLLMGLLFTVLFWDLSIVNNRTWPLVDPAIEENAEKIKIFQPRSLEWKGRTMIACNDTFKWECKSVVPVAVSYRSGTSSLVGHFPQGALENASFFESLINKYNEKKVDESIWYNISALTNLTYLIAIPNYSFTTAWSIPLNPNSILVSPAIEYFNKDSKYPKDVLKYMGINYFKGTANVIPVQPLFSRNEMNLQKNATNLSYKVHSFRQEIQETFYDLELASDLYISLPHSWYPYLDIRIDDKKIEPLKSLYGMIVLDVKSGRHSIKIKPTFSPLQRIGFLITVITFFSIIFLWRKK